MAQSYLETKSQNTKFHLDLIESQLSLKKQVFSKNLKFRKKRRNQKKDLSHQFLNFRIEILETENENK